MEFTTWDMGWDDFWDGIDSPPYWLDDVSGWARGWWAAYDYYWEDEYYA
jgi:hypothetical protein